MAPVHNGFKEYKIKDERNDTEVTVVPELGGMLTGFRVKGKEILYLNSELLKEREIRAGGFPVLFPVSGSLEDGAYTVNDETYNMPQHGFARKCEWTVEDENLQEHSITLVLSASDETRKYYPFDFNVFLTYKLSDGALIIRQEVENNSKTPMPFCSGYHPFFIASDKHSIGFDINAEKFIDYNKGQPEEFKGTVDFSQPVDHVFFNLTSNTHAYTSERDGYSLKMTLDSKMTALVLWTMEGKQFICLEPWMAKPNALNTGEDVCKVDPGSRASVEMKMEIEVF